MTNIGYVFAAYSLTWVGVFGYLVMLWRKQTRLEQRMRQVEQHLRGRS